MENKTNWCVYMHENRENGKKYIGITSQKPTRRWQNGGHYEGCTAFFRAIKKYGWDGFRHEILFTELTQEDAERLEVEMIAKYHTTDPEHGYNISHGGAARAGWCHTPEARAKMSASRTGHIVSPETRAKLRESNAGKKRSPEARAKMSQAKKGRPGRKWTEDDYIKHKGKRPPEIPAARKAVKQFTLSGELIQEHPSRKAAEAATGVRRNAIAACCRGSQETAGGFKWTDADQLSPADIDRPTHSEVMRIKRGRSVRCVETGETFGSISEAAERMRCQASKISACCNGKRHTAGGYHWSYSSEVVSADA